MAVNFFSVNPILINRKNENVATNSATSLRLRPQLTKDTVSFGQNRDLLQLPKEQIIEKALSSIQNYKNKIGSGSTALVYKIENTDYCIKIPRDIATKGVEIEKLLKTLTLNINEQDKVNHIVAKCENGSRNDSPTIMKIIEGESIRELKDYREIVSKMPQEAYDKLYSQFCNAKKQQMKPDIFWENMIIDKKNQTMTAIDFFDEVSFPNVLKEIHSMLTCNLYGNKPAPTKIDAKCAKKLLLASIKDFEPHKTPQQNLEDYKFEEYLYLQEGYETIDKENSSKLLEQLNKIIALKTNEINGQNVNNKLKNEIENAKIMIDLYFKDY